MELQAITGQLYIVDGEVQETTAVPGLLAQPAPRRAHRNRVADFLFLHLTLDGKMELDDALAHDLVEAFTSVYYKQAGGVNGALRKAIAHVNNLLLRWNVSTAGLRREGAITCAVLRDEELFMVQVGPSLALMGHNFGVERLPAHEPERVTPLGSTAHLDFRFAHYRLTAGDMLLLADPALDPVPVPALQPALVDTEVEIGLVELADVVGVGSTRCMLIEFNDDVPLEFPDSLPLEVPVTQEEMPRKGVSVTSVADPIREKVVQTVNKDRVEYGARKGAASAARGLSKLSGGMADMLTTLRPPDEQRPNRKEDGMGWALPTVIAIIIPLVIAVVFLTVYIQTGRSSEVADAKRDMELALQDAQAAEDPTSARALYEQALAIGIQIETNLKANDGDVAQMRLVANDALDRLDNITRLLATPIYTYPEDSLLTALALGDELNGDLYVLDGAKNQVLQHTSEENYANFSPEEPNQILFTGMAVNAHTVGTLVDLYWRPRGTAVSRDGVAVLDSRGVLLTYSPSFADNRVANLGLASNWRQPTRISGYRERLYLLDPQASQIWRYFPDGDQFTIQEDNLSVTFADESDMTNVTDFGIYGVDGTVMLIYNDGRVRLFDRGRTILSESDLVAGGLTAPLQSPTRLEIVGDGSTASIYVLDPPTGRIIQFARGGTLLAQYRISDNSGLELLERATDFRVIENPLRIFFTADNVVYEARLR